MAKIFRNPWAMGVLSAFLLNLPFPIAGPLPVWRSVVAWFALVPLLYAILSDENRAHPKLLRRSCLSAYLCGVLWYLLNCYWIFATMHTYGGIGSTASAGILLLYSLVLGLYFGVFGLLVALFQRAFGRTTSALIAAPFLWVALELAASRITSVPWDQLGYSQVDNFLLTRLAPFTGVYGISLVLMAGNAVLAGALLARSAHMRLRLGVGGVLAVVALQLGSFIRPAPAPTQATAVLLQENLTVGHGDDADSNDWAGPEWDRHTGAFLALSNQTCGPYLAGMPELQAEEVKPDCSHPPTANLIAWPEAPSPFRELDPRFQALMKKLTEQTHAPVVVGNEAKDEDHNSYNSAEFVAPDGNFIGRYDKIHLVPFGEYVPYKGLIAFAGTLTQGVGEFSRGKYRKVFQSEGHRFGIFICYEAVFADEVRHFAEMGAEVLVNISDDGWYGDTSAPWQHLNMARMRAIENRRWILRATNTGVTAAIDPYGRLTQSAPRHVLTSLAVQYGYRDDITFYSRYGDVFATLCAIIAIVGTARAVRLTVNAAYPNLRKSQVPRS
jgi:apolipoprotein N-acyltransferase